MIILLNKNTIENNVITVDENGLNNNKKYLIAYKSKF